MATLRGEELRAAGFEHYRSGAGSEIWRKVLQGVELLATVEADGRVLLGRYTGSRMLGSDSYPGVQAAAVELARRYPGASEEPLPAPAAGLRVVDRDTFEAGRAGGDE